jgi:hypothetical protein
MMGDKELTNMTYASMAIRVIAAYYISGYFVSGNYRYMAALAGIPLGYLLNKKVYPKLKGSSDSDSDSDSGSE